MKQSEWHIVPNFQGEPTHDSTDALGKCWCKPSFKDGMWVHKRITFAQIASNRHPLNSTRKVKKRGP